MSLKDGEFVTIEVSMWRMSDNSLVRTTDRALAEKAGIYSEELTYMPQLVIIGKDNTLRGIQEALRNLDVGQVKTFEMKPDEAFGTRNQDLVRVMPIAEFRKHDMDPVPGMQVDIDGAVATVRSVNSGRVTIDANHPFAGESLKCEVKVVARLEQDQDRLRAVFVHYKLEPERVAVKEKVGTVGFGPAVKKDARFLIDKANAIAMALQYMDTLSKIVVEEEYVREAAEKEKK